MEYPKEQEKPEKVDYTHKEVEKMCEEVFKEVENPYRGPKISKPKDLSYLHDLDVTKL